MNPPLVEIENLRIKFPSRDDGTQYLEAVQGVSFVLGKEKLGIVGESGSGKSLTGRTLLGISPDQAVVTADRLRFAGIDLLKASHQTLRGIRGSRIGMILQDPNFSLNPVMTVGRQVVEAVRVDNRRLSRGAAKKIVVDMFTRVQINKPDKVFSMYPHELSGGMGQRVMIAMMLIREPDLLIADEPTSALDVSVQQKVLEIMNDQVERRGMGLIFISHDLNVVSRFCDRIIVMFKGRVVESLAADRLHAATHPYTRGLLNCMPQIGGPLAPLPTLDRNAPWAR